MRKNLFTFLVGWMQQTWNLWLDMSLPLSNAMLVLRGSGLCRQSNGTRPLNTMCDGDAITLQGLTFIVNLLQGTLCRLVCMLGRGQMCQLQIGIICRLRSRPTIRPSWKANNTSASLNGPLLLSVVHLISLCLPQSPSWVLTTPPISPHVKWLRMPTAPIS